MGGDSSKIWKFVNNNERMRDLKGKLKTKTQIYLNLKMRERERERERLNRYPMT